MRKQNERKIFLNWLTIHSHPLQFVDAGNISPDLQPLKAILQNVQVVGLGEATHGTSEFVRTKHRLLEFLVKEMGFNTIYMEDPMNSDRDINDYVLYDKGNLDTVTARSQSLPMYALEIKAVIKWVHDYNKSQTGEHKVSFLGFDPQGSEFGLTELKHFYHATNPAKAVLIDSLTLEIAAKTALIYKATDSISLKKIKALCAAINANGSEVLTDMMMQAGRYSQLVGEDQFEKSLEDVKQIIQEAEIYKDGSFASATRDQYMAENILEHLRNVSPDTRIVVWAHNGHISKDSTTTNINMGFRLRQALKDKYYSFGFEFYSGEFRTYNRDISHKGMVHFDWMLFLWVALAKTHSPGTSIKREREICLLTSGTAKVTKSNCSSKLFKCTVSVLHFPKPFPHSC